MKKIIAVVILAVVAATFFGRHGAEACAEYAWLCYGRLHRRLRLLSGHRKQLMKWFWWQSLPHFSR